MSHRFVRCPHCHAPHDAMARLCPTTGLRLSATPSRPPPAEPMLLGQTLGGRYKIRGVLGKGGMGMVYDAEHIGLRRQVAIKVMNLARARTDVAVQRFEREARAAGAIHHPNICEVFDLGTTDDGRPYLVMERLVGMTLADRLEREGPLPFQDVVDIVIQVLAGLSAAHEKGFLHRDIKPDNLFIAERRGQAPTVKVLDFGVSKPMRDDAMVASVAASEDEVDLTRTGMVMGTPYYMSPEQAQGERDLDGRVDVYATGVVMYEALTGRRPFTAGNYAQLLLAILNTTPRPISEFRPATPPQLEHIVMLAMHRDRNVRYPSANAMLRDLMPQPSRSVVRPARTPRELPLDRPLDDDDATTVFHGRRRPIPSRDNIDLDKTLRRDSAPPARPRNRPR